MRLPAVFDNSAPSVGQPLTADQLRDLDKPANDCADMQSFLTRVNDIVEGEDVIKSKREAYLPKFIAETSDEYDFRIQCAKFTNVYRDVLEGLASKPFEREIKLDGTDEEFDNFVENVDGANNNLTVFAIDWFFNAINSSVDWLFVDYSNVQDNAPRTLAEQQARGIRPYWTHVRHINMLEIQSTIINGAETLTFVRILEPGDPTRVRVMWSDGSRARFELYRKNPSAQPNDAPFIIEDAGIISIGIIPLVPLVTGRRKGKRWSFYPPMKDAANLQIHLYRNETALENIKLYGGYPMLAGQGISPTQTDGKTPDRVAVKPNGVLYAPMAGNGNHGQWEWISPDAAVLKFLQDDVDKNMQQIRELGRQPLTAQSTNLTVIGAQVAAGKAISAVQMWAISLKDAIENALVLTGKWLKSSTGDNITADVFTDWNVGDDTKQDISMLINMRANGDLSQPTLWSEAKRRNVLSAEFDPDEEKKALLAEVPGDGEDSLVDPLPPAPGNTPPAPGAGKPDLTGLKPEAV